MKTWFPAALTGFAWRLALTGFAWRLARTGFAWRLALTGFAWRLALTSALLVTGCVGSMPGSIRHPLAGAQAPTMPDMKGEGTEVGIWHGSVVKATVLDFWASWCAGCQESLPALDALYRDKRDEGLRVVGVSLDQKRDDAFATARALNATFPIVVDSDARLLSQYRVAQVPLTFLVDRAGTVRWVGRDTGDLRRAVEVVLAE